MATRLNGTKISEVTGDVKYTGATGLFKMISCKPGSLVLYKLASDSFFVHTIVPGQIRKPAKLQVKIEKLIIFTVMFVIIYFLKKEGRLSL